VQGPGRRELGAEGKTDKVKIREEFKSKEAERT